MGFSAGLRFTNKGRRLKDKGELGQTIIFTKLWLGDGSYSGLPDPLTGLISPKISLEAAIKKLIPGTGALVGATLPMSAIITGFYWRELGLYAQDPDEGEILYAYGNAGSSAEWLDPGGTADLRERSISVLALTGNATSISAIFGASVLYATQAELQDLAGPGRTTETVVGAYAAAEAATPTPVIVTLAAANWVTQAGLPTQTVPLPGMVPEDLIVSCLPETLTLAQAKAIGKGVLMLRNQQAGSVDVVCLGTAPAINVPFAILWYGGGN